MFRQTFRRVFGRTLLIGGAALAAAAAHANPFETTLPNGMKLIVKEDHRAPSAVHMVWYRSGAMDETDGVSGVAHVLEHMMFKGTLEADRMKNLVITDDEFRRELEVVKEERRLRTDDQPRSLVYEQIAATAFQAHPYRRPVIGWMTDLDTMRPQDARDWYRRWYTPNNAYLVVVGDVDH